MTSTNCVSFLVAGVFIVIGVVYLVRVIAKIHRISASKSWIQVNATISNVSLEYSSGNKGQKHYWVEFSYRYQVMGNNYFGDYKKDSFIGSEGTAADEAASHPRGSTISVRVNPENPSKSISEFDSVGFWELLIPCMLIIFPIIGLIIGPSTSSSPHGPH